ncbi:MAG: export transporter periplasmic protein LptC [Pseudomonadota bacterium]|jgi:lipopolysaccharide export system protein LptC
MPMATATLTSRQRAALPGSYRDTLFGVLKWLLPTLALLLLATIVIWPLSSVQEFSFLLAKDKVAMATERLRVNHAVYRGETAKGEAFKISAAGAVQHSSAVPIVELDGLTADLAMADGPARVTAPHGRYFIEDDRLQIIGPVQLDSTAGYSLDSATVDIDLNSRRVATGAGVTGTLPLGTFSAGSLTGDIQGRKLVLNGGVHLRTFGRKGRAAG